MEALAAERGRDLGEGGARGGGNRGDLARGKLEEIVVNALQLLLLGRRQLGPGVGAAHWWAGSMVRSLNRFAFISKRGSWPGAAISTLGVSESWRFTSAVKRSRSGS